MPLTSKEASIVLNISSQEVNHFRVYKSSEHRRLMNEWHNRQFPHKHVEDDSGDPLWADTWHVTNGIGDVDVLISTFVAPSEELANQVCDVAEAAFRHGLICGLVGHGTDYRLS